MSTCKIVIKNKYIVLPINMKHESVKIRFFEGEKLALDIDAHIDPATPSFYSYVDMREHLGKTVTIDIPCDGNFTPSFVDEIPTQGHCNEKYRPMVHFSAKIGWINDPNGLVFAGGIYHMFFQHNPAGSDWGNMTWGHATSNDLVHWNEKESALLPDELGTMFSGSAVVDMRATNGESDTILLYYTAAGGTSELSKGKRFTQCMAYSTDGGMTFKKSDKNPIVGHIKAENRDPKVIWCDELFCYIMALYLDGSEYALLRSDDLTSFTELQRIELQGDGECPDFFPLNVDGDPTKRLWVLCGASDRYLVGKFKDGKFTPIQRSVQYFFGHRTSYAAQSFSNVRDRRIRVAWNPLHAPDSVFENQMGIPTELSLRTVGDTIRLSTLPIAEFETLRVSHFNECRKLDRAAYDIELTAPKDSQGFAIGFFGYEIIVKPHENTLSYGDVTMPLSYSGGDISLRIISDTLGCELYADGGLIYSVIGGCTDYERPDFKIEPICGSDISKVDIKIHKLKNI